MEVGVDSLNGVITAGVFLADRFGWDDVADQLLKAKAMALRRVAGGEKDQTR
jgi:hypothetical protein